MTVKILLIEPYYGGSHRSWADGFAKHSQHQVQLLTLPAQFWKWRMQGGAVTLSRLFLAGAYQPDIILASDMMDLSIFRALTREQTHHLPIVLYFHENQLTYPQNRRQGHGWRYGFINYASALAADAIYFNSAYHMQNFFEALPRMLKHFADFNELQTVQELRAKSVVLPLGLDFQRFDAHRTRRSAASRPLILWNHRWEADKNPAAFFDALYQLDTEGFEFELAVLGQNFRQDPAEFEQARQHFGEGVIAFGYLADFADYARLLWQADYVISTAYQDFFGIAVAEAVYCGCVPLLANRLNYPHLLPQAYHRACLFGEGKLPGLLRQHLLGNLQVNVQLIQKNIAQFDWATMAQIYDLRLLELLH